MSTFADLATMKENDTGLRIFVADAMADARSIFGSVPKSAYLEGILGPRLAADVASRQKTAQGAHVAGDPPVVSPWGTAFLGYVNAVSAFGGPAWLRVPAYTRVGVEASDGPEAAVVLEGEPIPVGRYPADIEILTPLKLGIITTATRELVESGDESAQGVISRKLTHSVAAGVDATAFDPENSVSLAFGATEIPATANVADDIRSLFDALSGGVPSRPALILGAGAARALVFSGDPVFKDVGLTGRGSIGNVPTFTSISRTISHLAIAVDADGVMVTDAGVAVTAARNASLVMDDAPSGGPQQLVSAWQANTIVFKALRYLGWTRRADAIAFADIGASAS